MNDLCFSPFNNKINALICLLITNNYKDVCHLCLEAINGILAVEDEARQAKLVAQKKALEAAEEAIKRGKETVASTLARAESEIAHLRRQADQKASEQAVELASTTANRQATLRARAERRLDTAAQMIVERILKT